MDTDIVVALFTLLGGIGGAHVGVFGGYYLGIGKSRNERRDEAIAEIFKEMSLFYRGMIHWTNYPTSTSWPITSPDTTWEQHCRKRFEIFSDTFYGNGIWLGESTYERIQGFAQSALDFLNELNQMNGEGKLLDGTHPWDRREQTLSDDLYEIENTLRDEMEKSRYIIPYRS